MHVRRKADHFEHDLVVGLGVLAPGSPTEIGRVNSVPSTCTMADAAGFEVGADELVRFALDDLDDFAFGIAELAVRARLESRTSTVSPLEASPASLAAM